MASIGAVIAEAGGPPENALDFDRLVTAARDQLTDVATEVGRSSITALETLGSVQIGLGGAQERFPEAVADMVDQINRFVYPGSLSGVGAGRVPDVGRYLSAIEIRLGRLPEQPKKDAETMERIRRLDAELDRFADAIGMTPDLIEVAWMIEELRVSLFAQHLGTRGKVSEKRIERALDDAVR
ncbi:DUF3418 domain-containing protein, partial [bacterium]|nr:DUF3418 domain-containing protein [bacterium]